MKEVKENLTAEKVLKLLEKSGTKITLAEAEMILQFMKKLAKITVNQYLREC